MKLIITKENLKESARSKPLESVTIEDLRVAFPVTLPVPLLDYAELIAVVEGDSAMLLKNRDGATGFIISKSQLTEMLFSE